jgi:sortase A
VPQNGDPVSGGNFVLAAHRFNLGLTPQQTRLKSPFYYIDKLGQGDDVYVDYQGVRYAYKVSKRYKVNADQVSIEARTADARLTMYSCDLGGPQKGREVVEALPVGTIAWLNGSPKLKATQ